MEGNDTSEISIPEYHHQSQQLLDPTSHDEELCKFMSLDQLVENEPKQQVVLEGKNFTLTGLQSDHSRLEAMAGVLNTTKLFEQILIHLPTVDLILSAPRVCRAFRMAVAQTPSLLMKAFMKPDYDPAPVKALRWYGRHILNSGQPIDRLELEVLDSEPPYPLPLLDLNSESFDVLSKSQALLNRLVTQPPSRSIGIRVDRQFFGAGFRATLNVQAHDGVKFEDVVRMLDETWNSPSGSTHSDWEVRVRLVTWELMEKDSLS